MKNNRSNAIDAVARAENSVQVAYEHSRQCVAFFQQVCLHLVHQLETSDGPFVYYNGHPLVCVDLTQECLLLD